jgi:pimeloyl-ACP methyl ester carboxylesterase
MSIELAFDRLDGARGERTIAFLHGILGRGNNLRTIAKRFIQVRPEWTALLVDLRGHGRSPKGTAHPSLEAAAQDIVQLGMRAVPPLGAIVGHSFGGKVALEAARAGVMPSLNHVVVIDSSPSVREPLSGGDSALTIIETIESLPRTFPSNSDFVKALTHAGHKRDAAYWLAQSVEREGDHVRFTLDLEEVRALSLDYYACDLWPVVESPPGKLCIHLVIADRSSEYSPSDRERAAQIAAAKAQVSVDTLPAGHLVHVDAADGLLRTLIDRLSQE